MAGHLVSSQSPGLAAGAAAGHYALSGQGRDPRPVPEPREDGVNWGRYISALRRYRWLMLAIVLAGTGAGVVATRLIPLEFRATTTVWVEGSDAGRMGPLRTGELLDAMGWVQLLQTPLVYDPVVQKLRLYVQPEDRKEAPAFAARSM